MKKLPVIVGLGGMNAAGRTSGFHGYKRLVEDVLSLETMHHTWFDLAHRMKISTAFPMETMIEKIQQGTLIRRIEQFDPNKVRCHHLARLDHRAMADFGLLVKKNKCSSDLLSQFRSILNADQELALKPQKDIDILLEDTFSLGVSSAGSLPSGFDLDALYHSHHHPRGLKLTVYGMSDALNSLGFEWNELLQHISPDQVAVYAGSALSQIDEYSLSGLISHPLMGQRVSSKMMPLSLAEMPADFINSYIINSIGLTGHNVGACATFLYNLKLGVQDIQSGRARVVIVGAAEAPIVPEVIEGFRVMGALATDEALSNLDGVSTPNYRRACRPFSSNAGFTLGESAQFFVLMDDELALTLGASIYGSVPDVFVHADGNKKSIASPGVGNYVTMAKTMALTRAMLGDHALHQTYVQAHGTGTPQNRTTESHILNEISKTFGLSNWNVSAIKSYLGHSIAVAGGDQLAVALGVWSYGWIPGIKTIDHIAEDVHHSHLSILKEHVYVGEQGKEIKAAVLNSKGFGGNNASALVLSPHETKNILKRRYGQPILTQYQSHHELIQDNAKQRDEKTCFGDERIIYSFGEAVMSEKDVVLSQSELKLNAFQHSVSLEVENPYA